ncbi:MAG TPA: sensor histidine kinase [Firmicutes bacterium]|nr:sensor histidine kinase [Bacillota bacterium]
MRKILDKFSLSLYFSLSIFIMYSITLTITGSLIYLIIHLDVFSEDAMQNPILVVFVTIISCLIVGTVFSHFASREILKTIKVFMEATKKLASGDFTVRLNITRPLEYKYLSANFNHMAEELAGIEVLRTDFINNFSHEFKTPIVSIKGFAEILKDDDLTKEERHEYLDIVIEESTRLASLATNVLNLSKIETQSILTEKQRFNIGEQMRQCILLLEMKLEKHKLQLVADIYDEYLTGNKELLNQVWLNLLDNAIKFTPADGIIQVSVRKVEQAIEIKISDTGMGVSEEAMLKIFDKFYQQDTSHATKGNGLGLSIAKKIVDLHKGSIKCESTVHKGTVFSVLLPVEQEKEFNAS